MKRLLSFLFLSMIGCSSYDAPPNWATQPVVKKHNFDRLFMNKPNEYLVLAQQGDELKPMYISLNWMEVKFGTIRLLKDVPDGQPMWAECREFQCLNYDKVRHSGSDGVPKNKVEWDIHIHRVADVEGGRWQDHIQGKPPKTVDGNNKVIE